MPGDHQRRMRLSDRTLSLALAQYAWLKGYRFTRAKSPDEIDAANRFIFDIFLERGFYDFEQSPEPLEEEGSEPTLFVARHRGQVAGALELTRNPCHFTVEDFFAFDFPASVDRNQTAELARFSIAQRHRGKNPVAAVGLLAEALRFSIEHNIRWWIGCTPALLLASFAPLFRDWNCLPELPPGERQLKYRKGREGYFRPENANRVFLIDVDSVSYGAAAATLIRKRRQARKRRSHRR